MTLVQPKLIDYTNHTSNDNKSDIYMKFANAASEFEQYSRYKEASKFWEKAANNAIKIKDKVWAKNRHLFCIRMSQPPFNNCHWK